MKATEIIQTMKKSEVESNLKKVNVFSYTAENVSTHRRSTRGWKYHGTVSSVEEFHGLLAGWHDADWFPGDDGEVKDCNGDVVISLEYPKEADFGDIRYQLVDPDLVNEDHEKAMEIDQ